MNDVEAQLVALALASPEAFQLVFVDVMPTPVVEACSFTAVIICDPPLRGGVRLLSNDRSNACSAGFLARSRTDGKPYVLTAGHCNVEGPQNWITNFSDTEPHAIGPFHNSRYDTTVDAGVLRVNNPVGWEFGRPWITVDPSAGQAVREAYPIYRVLNPGLHDRVCATLTVTSRTDCGDVESTNRAGDLTLGVFEVDRICSNFGDSGGPYFADNVAYGVHHAGDGVPGTTGCLFGLAEHAIEAATSMNVYILEG